MLAIQEVTETLIINQTTGKEIRIHSDSQAALKSLNKRKISNQTTLDAMNTLNKLSKKLSFEVLQTQRVPVKRKVAEAYIIHRDRPKLNNRDEMPGLRRFFV